VAARPASDPGHDDGSRLRLVFMGTPPLAAASLQALLDGRHDVVAVVTQPDRPSGRGHKLQQSAVKQLAARHDLPVLQPARPADPRFVADLRALAPDLGVVVAYGRILPNDVLDAPRMGCINAHASLLPRLRGAAPVVRAILEGLDGTGVTIMRISERMDAGDIMMTAPIPIGPTTTGGELTEAVASTAASLLVEAVDAMADGTAEFTPQDESQATYAPPLVREESCIDWAAPTAVVDGVVRAFAPRPGAFTFDGGRRLKIVSARPCTETPDADAGVIVGARGTAMLVTTGDGSMLVETVQPEGKRAMDAAAYLNGCGLAIPRQLGTTD